MGSISVDSLSVSINDLLKGHQDMIQLATEDGLEAAEATLISALSDASPKGTGKFSRSWKGRESKDRLHRYVGNTKTVKAKTSDKAPLSNILEYSKKFKVRGFIKRTYEATTDAMIEAVIATINDKIK